VLRLYPRNQDCFLRVHFTDEARLQYRWDRDVDGDSFIKERVGGILHNGFNIAGKHFDFLAYSSASLKEHCVWFCTPFRVPGKGLITAQSILAGLGNFDRVIYCPARYGARISQAFSATDPSIAITAEELIPINDIKIGESLFTDGIGTMSREIADDIWDALARLRGGKRQRRSIQAPSAYQVRIGGYKGSYLLHSAIDTHADFRNSNRNAERRPRAGRARDLRP
jgi:RNA-dependent RNA polymerase